MTNVSFYRGNLNNPEDRPSLQYKIIPGKENTVKELKKYITLLNKV